MTSNPLCYPWTVAVTAKLKPLLELVDTERVTLVAVPLRNRQNEAIGVLCLLYRQTGETPQGDHTAQIAFMRALVRFCRGQHRKPPLAENAGGPAGCFYKADCRCNRRKITLHRRTLSARARTYQNAGPAACESRAPPFVDYQLRTKNGTRCISPAGCMIAARSPRPST